MTIQFIKNIVTKEYNLSGENKQWWFDKIESLPKNKWFEPNDKDKDFSCCRDLFNIGLCSVKREPVWKNNSFLGTKISFYFTITKK